MNERMKTTMLICCLVLLSPALTQDCKFYEYLSNGVCKECSVKFPSCLSCNETSCLQCTDGFYYVPDRHLCVQSCKYADEEFSFDQVMSPSRHRAKYYSDSYNMICRTCNENCVSCQDEIGCTSCTTDLNQDLGQYFLKTVDGFGECVPCTNDDSSCALCDSTGECLVRNSMTLETQQPCSDSNCKICSDDATVCQACKLGFTLEDELCVNQACDDSNCLSCNSDVSSCDQCMLGYFKNSDGQCSSCPSNCAQCSDSSTCSVCTDGFVLSLEGQCLQSCGFEEYVTTTVHQLPLFGTLFESKQCSIAECDESCETCLNNSNGDNKCLTCPPGSYLVITDDIAMTGNCLAKGIKDDNEEIIVHVSNLQSDYERDPSLQNGNISTPYTDFMVAFEAAYRSAAPFLSTLDGSLVTVRIAFSKFEDCSGASCHNVSDHFVVRNENMREFYKNFKYKDSYSKNFKLVIGSPSDTVNLYVKIGQEFGFRLPQYVEIINVNFDFTDSIVNRVDEYAECQNARERCYKISKSCENCNEIHQTNIESEKYPELFSLPRTPKMSCYIMSPHILFEMPSISQSSNLISEAPTLKITGSSFVHMYFEFYSLIYSDAFTNIEISDNKIANISSCGSIIRDIKYETLSALISDEEYYQYVNIFEPIIPFQVSDYCEGNDSCLTSITFTNNQMEDYFNFIPYSDHEFETISTKVHYHYPFIYISRVWFLREGSVTISNNIFRNIKKRLSGNVSPSEFSTANPRLIHASSCDTGLQKDSELSKIFITRIPLNKLLQMYFKGSMYMENNTFEDINMELISLGKERYLEGESICEDGCETYKNYISNNTFKEIRGIHIDQVWYINSQNINYESELDEETSIKDLIESGRDTISEEFTISNNIFIKNKYCTHESENLIKIGVVYTNGNPFEEEDLAQPWNVSIDAISEAKWMSFINNTMVEIIAEKRIIEFEAVNFINIQNNRFENILFYYDQEMNDETGTIDEIEVELCLCIFEDTKELEKAFVSSYQNAIIDIQSNEVMNVEGAQRLLMCEYCNQEISIYNNSLSSINYTTNKAKNDQIKKILIEVYDSFAWNLLIDQTTLTNIHLSQENQFQNEGWMYSSEFSSTYESKRIEINNTHIKNFTLKGDCANLECLFVLEIKQSASIHNFIFEDLITDPQQLNEGDITIININAYTESNEITISNLEVRNINYEGISILKNAFQENASTNLTITGAKFENISVKSTSLIIIDDENMNFLIDDALFSNIITDSPSIIELISSKSAIMSNLNVTNTTAADARLLYFENLNTNNKEYPIENQVIISGTFTVADDDSEIYDYSQKSMISFENCHNIQIQSSIFSGLKMASKGAAISSVSSTVAISDSVFLNNSAYEGGAIFLESNSIISITNCTFNNNFAKSLAGAFSASDQCQVNTKDCTFVKNKANISGVFQVISNSRLTDENSSFVNNTAINESSIGFLMESQGNMFNNTLISLNNVEESKGKAIHILKSEAKFLNSNLTDNQASSKFKSLYVTLSSVEITNCTFEETYSISSMDALTTFYGGFIFSIESDISIYSSTFKNGIASEGGAIFSSTQSDLSIYDSTFEDNSSIKAGGSIASSLSKKLLISNTMFYNSISSIGDAVSIDSSNVDSENMIESSSFIKNASSSSPLNVHGSNFLSISSSSLTILDTEFTSSIL